jgi:hypothetical protein
MKNRRSVEKKMKAYSLFERDENGTYHRIIGNWKIWASNLGSARSQAQHQMYQRHGSGVGLPFAVVLPDNRPHIHPGVMNLVSKITESTFYIWHRHQNKSFSGYELEKAKEVKPTLSATISTPLPVSLLADVGEVLKSNMIHYADKLRDAVKNTILSRNPVNS